MRVRDASELTAESKLFGRTKETQQLLASLESVCRGQGELVVLSGLSGSGKTALANVLREPTRCCNGFFLDGKFNQYDSNIAYGAWRNALAEFCRYVRQQDGSRRQRWVDGIRHAVGDNGQLLVDLVPEFGDLLGQQNPVASISLQESRHRFAAVIRETLKVICQPEHPLVLFIDDWQWADPASIQLLHDLRIGTSLRYVLVICSLRSDEVDKGHGFSLSLGELEKMQVPIQTIDVMRLNADETRRLVLNATSAPELLGRDVIREIQATSEGNPFFAHALVEMLTSKRFSEEAIVGFREHGLPIKIVDVFTHRIASMDPGSRKLLSLAACLGHRFNVETLSTISGSTRDECEALVQSCDGMVVPQGGTWKDESTRDASTQWYQFAHDQVQQAAYLQIPAEEMPAIRLDIARRMVAHLPPDELAERAYEVADHFNAGADLISGADEFIWGVELNVAAARKARAATAFCTALESHRAALRLVQAPDVSETLWRDHEELAVTLFLEGAESELVEGDKLRAEALVRATVDRVGRPSRKAEALTILVVQYTLQARYQDAISIGREALSVLGISLPVEHYEEARDAEIRKVRTNLEGRDLYEFVNGSVATDDDVIAAAKVLIAMGPPCYRAHQQLWSVIVPRVVNIALQHGPIPQLGYSFPGIAGLLGWVANDYKTGRGLYDVSTSLANSSLLNSSDKSVFHLMVGSSCRHWFSHLSDCSRDYDAAVEIGRQSGNLQYAAYAFGHNMYCRFFQGTELAVVEREAESALGFSRTRHNQWAIDLLEGGLQIIRDVSGSGNNTPDDVSWENSYLEKVESHQNQQVACIYYVMRAHQHLIMRNYDLAWEYSEKAAWLLHTIGTQGLLPWAEHVFVRALVLAQLCTESKEVEVLRRFELDGLIGQLRVWASHCPANFEHMYLLAKAEVARLEGSFEAVSMFDAAIDAAHNNGFVQFEGLANELAAQFWSSQQNSRFEQVYWQHAYESYERWGATAKLDAMICEFRQQLSKRLELAVPSDSDAADVQRATRNRLLDRHVELMKNRAQARAQAHQQAQAMLTAEELANAANTLRADVAEGRRSEAELREQRDLEHNLNRELERRVKKRTADLEAVANELRETNSALEQMEQRFRATFESTPAAMVMINDQGCVELVNAETETLFAYPREELLGNGIELLFPKRFRPGGGDCRLDVFFNPAARRIGTGGDFYGLRKDGSEFPIEIGLNPVQTNEGLFVLAAIVDITERKRAEDQFRQANATLAQSNTELEQFAYVASHDLQEPLRKIASYCQLLKEEQAERLDEEGKSYLDIAINGAQRLQCLVQDLLAFSRVNTRGKPLAESDANDSLEEAIGNLSHLIEERGAVVSTVGLPHVMADPGQLTHLFQNLISNAIKYCAEPKPEVSICYEDFGSQYRFSVRDNGIGIDPKYHEKIFQIFQRLHNRRAYSGTGIGLALSKRIVERFGGEITVESTPGAGSTFYFNLNKPPFEEDTNASGRSHFITVGDTN